MESFQLMGQSTRCILLRVSSLYVGIDILQFEPSLVWTNQEIRGFKLNEKQERWKWGLSELLSLSGGAFQRRNGDPPRLEPRDLNRQYKIS